MTVAEPRKTHGTIDTVSMQHLCRPPAVRVRRKRKEEPTLALSLIATAMRQRRLKLYLDTSGGLKSEWSKTCGHDTVQQLLVLWTDLGGIALCQPLGAIKPQALHRRLYELDFVDACDKLIVRIGRTAVVSLEAAPFLIATNDSDFWDPRDVAKKGNINAPVAKAVIVRPAPSCGVEQAG
jgi:hypothetical protein